MIKLVYNKEYIELFYESSHGELIEFQQWSSKIENPTYSNIINDLIVNGIATFINKERISIAYEDLAQIDEYEYKVLELPKQYPYDIFIDISGSGLKDTNLKLRYSFQDFAHKNGSGNIIFNKEHRIGAYLKNDLEFLLTTKQFALISQIEKFNRIQFTDSNTVLKELSTIQKLAIEADAVLSQILVETLIIAPEKIKIDIVKIDDNKFKLKPFIKEVDSAKLQKNFEIFPRVKTEYSFREENKKVRIIIDDTENEASNSIKSELQKLKNKNIINEEEVNEIYNSPTKFWDTDLIDIEDFGKRVLELGIYKPRFYPFISPYKSEWIPGIVIDDKKEGTRYITIKNQNELDELKRLKNESVAAGEKSISYKGEDIELKNIDSIIENAQAQINNPQNPVTTKEREREKPETQTKVLIIKENAEENEYSEFKYVDVDISYSFQQINNLSSNIHLKEHQKKGLHGFKLFPHHLIHCPVFY